METAKKYEYDVFLSFRNEDRKIVSRIAENFAREDIKVWFDEWVLVPGSLWQEELKKGVANSSAIAVFIGRGGLGKWQEQELKSLMKAGMEGTPNRVIPILLPEAQQESMPDFLQNFLAIQLTERLDFSEIKRLITSIVSTKEDTQPEQEWRIAVFGRLFGLLKYLFKKKDPPAAQQNIRQDGSSNTAANIDGSKNIVAGGDVNTGIDPNHMLDRYETALKQLGQSEKTIEDQGQPIAQLEEQLAQPSALASSGQEKLPQPTQEAKDIAAHIEDDAGPYALALKAIATGQFQEADDLLDDSQQLLDKVQEQKDQAQIKIYMARIQNSSYVGRHRQALQYCDKLLPLAGNDPQVLYWIAYVYHDNAKYDEAEPLYRRTLEIDQASFGPDHPEVATDLNNLAALLQATNRFDEAEPLMRRSLEIDKASFGPDHPKVASRLNNLAQLLQATNRLDEAEPLMRRALKIDEASLGLDHPDVAIDLNNLASLLKYTNRLDETEPMYRRALEIDEASFGLDHPDVARDLSNLASLLTYTNRLDEAEPLMRRALKIDEASFGPDHPDVARDLNNLSELLRATNRLDEAEPLMRRGLEIEEKSKGKNHPHVAIQLNNLAQLLQDTNRLDEAEPLMQRALKIDEASFGPDHPKVAIRLNNLAALFHDTNRLDEAESLIRRALETNESSFGPDHPAVAIDLNNLAQLLKATNRLDEAEPLMRRALEIDEVSFGPDHPNVATDLNNLALLFWATNCLNEAEPLMQRVLAIVIEFTRQTGHQHPHVETATKNYTILLSKMGYSKDQIDARLKEITEK